MLTIKNHISWNLKNHIKQTLTTKLEAVHAAPEIQFDVNEMDHIRREEIKPPTKPELPPLTPTVHLVIGRSTRFQLRKLRWLCHRSRGHQNIPDRNPPPKAYMFGLYIYLRYSQWIP
jgi:hypothetical protein